MAAAIRNATASVASVASGLELPARSLPLLPGARASETSVGVVNLSVVAPLPPAAARNASAGNAAAHATGTLPAGTGTLASTIAVGNDGALADGAAGPAMLPGGVPLLPPRLQPNGSVAAPNRRNLTMMAGLRRRFPSIPQDEVRP